MFHRTRAIATRSGYTTGMANPRVYFDITIGEQAAQRVEFELFADVVPKTAENFRALCTGEKGMGKSGKPLHYKGSRIFHRVIPQFMLQGWRLHARATAPAAKVDLRREVQRRELQVRSHDVPGTCCRMANAGPNTNGSQFFLTTASRLTWLDGKHVVFGKVDQGMDVVRAMEAVGSGSGETAEDVVITDCGEL